MEYLIILIPLFFLTALLYSMTGFGGGSTYLALLVLFSFPYQAMPKVALVCNLIVVTGGCYFFTKAGYFSLKKILPFVISSIPCAYLGGSLPVGKTFFTLLLGLSLCVAALRLIFASRDFQVRHEVSWKTALAIGLPVGAVLGGLAGLVGIGGGIFLLPVLYLLGWAHAKEAATAASFFILVNSLAGLAGQFNKGMAFAEWGFILPLGAAVFLGGQIGSRLGSGIVSKIALQRIAGLLILFVSAKLLWGIF